MKNETIVPLVGKEVNRASRRRGAKKGICKSLLKKERQQRCKSWRKHERSSSGWKWYPILQFKVDPQDPTVLILRNGMRIKQKEGLDVFMSDHGAVYSLTRRGLRRLRINYTRKRRYGKKSRNGVPNGRRYPYIIFRGGTYTIHILMVEIWIRPRREGEEIDHLDGNIDNFALNNLELVTVEENWRRRKILTAMRKASVALNDPSLDPKNKSAETMARIYHDITTDDPAEIMEADFTQYREF